ncbi:MAG: hypothetical protein CUN55_09235 [Phototrophicales bacterium]|nr:MAG: hypothetical protein CUN55_09235 [Phototrophicales bacterium]
MRDKRPVDELSIEELERILALRKREQRIARAQQARHRGRTISDAPEPLPQPNVATAIEIPTETQSHIEIAPTPKRTYDPDTVVFVDELDEIDQAKTPDLTKQLTNWGLLAIEIVAVLGLLFVLYQGFLGLQSIESSKQALREDSNRIQAARQTTPTPLPDLAPTALVLPGGHVYREDGNHTYNLAEYEAVFEQQRIPENLRPALQQQASISLTFTEPPQATDPIAIEIPRLGIDRASGKGNISRGADWETLTNGLGWYNNGANLANGKNIVIVGHNDIYGEIFKNLGDLEVGDEITIYGNSGQRYTYRVTDERIVWPNEVSVLDPNSGAGLTLITCYPYRVNDRRLVVFAERIN